MLYERVLIVRKVCARVCMREGEGWKPAGRHAVRQTDRLTDRRAERPAEHTGGFSTLVLVQLFVRGRNKRYTQIVPFTKHTTQYNITLHEQSRNPHVGAVRKRLSARRGIPSRRGGGRR